jgi:subtilisin family serine protease
MFLFLFLAFVGGVCSVERGSVRRLSDPDFDVLAAALGSDVVDDSFGSPAETKAATTFEVNAVNTLNAEEPLSLGCVPFETGLSLSEKYERFSEIRTFVSDRANDQMCFIYGKSDLLANTKRENRRLAEDEELEALFSKSVLQPGPTKVDVELLRLIETTETMTSLGDREKFLNMSSPIQFQIDYYRPTKINRDSLTEITPSAKLIDAVEILKTYPLGYFDTFFYSKVQDSDQEVSESEYVRNTLWREFKSSLTRELLSEEDPCGFMEPGMQPTWTEDYVSLEVDSLLSKPQKDTSACLALMVAVLTKEKSVSLVALSSLPSVFNFRAAPIIQTGSTDDDDDSLPYSEAGLQGKGQIVSIVDTGLDEESCFFRDDKGQVKRSDIGSPITDDSRRKVIQYTYSSKADTSDTKDGHGTHVAGIVAGEIDDDGHDKSKFRGVASEAKLTFMDLARPGTGLYVPSSSQLFGAGYEAGSRIQSHSFGTWVADRRQSYYGASIDKFLYKNSDFVVLYAAGNFGSANEGATITEEAQTKNAIIVGASVSSSGENNIGKVSFFSSKGPTYDGRIKPDIIAPGEALESAAASGNRGKSCEVTGKLGTSMATPAAAGAVVLIRQYFMDKNFWQKACIRGFSGDGKCEAFTPSGPLLKAMLLHSGERMKRYEGSPSKDLSSPPDIYQGYGRIKLNNILPLGSGGDADPNILLFVANNVLVKEKKRVRYALRVKSDREPLKVTLVWYDAPCDGKPRKALLNDLDLVVTDPNGDDYYGNGKKGDDVNTNEQVYISKPTEGRWKVAIYARGLPISRRQRFSLVVTYSRRDISSSDAPQPLSLPGTPDEDPADDNRPDDDIVEDLPSPTIPPLRSSGLWNLFAYYLGY